MELTIININGEIELIPELKNSKSVQSIQRKGKKLFDAFVIVLHYAYKKEGIYWNYSMRERLNLIQREHLGGYDIEKVNKDEDCIRVFFNIRHTLLTQAERFQEKVKDDLDHLVQKIESIPFEREGIYEQDVEGQDGIHTKVKVKVIIDNSEERTKAYKQVDAIFDIQDRLEKRIKSEKKIQTSDPEMRLFDSI